MDVPRAGPRRAWLAGYASLYWDAADAWFDEDEQVYGHLTDPFTRVDVRPTSRPCQLLAGDVARRGVAAPLRLDETGLPTRWYLAPGDVRARLESVRHPPALPVQGRVELLGRPPGRRSRPHRRRWGYPDPLPESARIAGHHSFLHDDLRTVVDGAEA